MDHTLFINEDKKIFFWGYNPFLGKLNREEWRVIYRPDTALMDIGYDIADYRSKGYQIMTREERIPLLSSISKKEYPVCKVCPMCKMLVDGRDVYRRPFKIDTDFTYTCGFDEYKGKSQLTLNEITELLRLDNCPLVEKE